MLEWLKKAYCKLPNALIQKIHKGVGSKIGVVRPGAREVNVAVLCAKAVRADGYLNVAHF